MAQSQSQPCPRMRAGVRVLAQSHSSRARQRAQVARARALWARQQAPWAMVQLDEDAWVAGGRGAGGMRPYLVGSDGGGPVEMRLLVEDTHGCVGGRCEGVL